MRGKGEVAARFGSEDIIVKTSTDEPVGAVTAGQSEEPQNKKQEKKSASTKMDV